MTLRLYLSAIFVALAMTPLVLFRLWPHSDVLEREREEAVRQHMMLASGIATALQRYHRELVATFEIVLSDINHWSHSPHVALTLSNLSIRHICIADPITGRVLTEISAAPADCPRTLPPKRLELVRKLSTGDGLALSGVTVTPDGENVILMVKRLDQRVAIAAVQTSYFRELGASVSFGESGHAIIFDQHGRVLFHPKRRWSQSRRDISDLLAVRRVLEEKPGVVTFYSPFLEKDVVAGAVRVPSVKWGVIVARPVDELDVRADDAFSSATLVFVLGLFIASLLASCFTLLLALPLKRLIKQAESISAGRMEQVTITPSNWLLPTEIRDLQAKFGSMVSRIAEVTGTINRLAFIDSVTGLANREFFRRRIGEIVSAKEPGALIFLDLDGFKAVNDTFGHDAGDQLLEIVGRRLCAVLGAEALKPQSMLSANPPASDCGGLPLISRLGGDEFAIFVKIESEELVKGLTDEILVTIRTPHNIGDETIRLGASIGIAFFPAHGESYSLLLKSADTAMYVAKRRGKNRQVVYQPEMSAALVERNRLADDVRAALEDGQLTPYFQPQFRNDGVTLLGIEALVRWEHPTKGTLGPDAFFATAEELGLMRRIDELVLEKSLVAVRRAQRAGFVIPTLSVNISHQRVRDPALTESVEALGELPCQLNFELLESIYLDQIDQHSRATLEQLRMLGVGLELDDFGSGHASIIALLNLRPNKLKIDRRLISKIASDNDHLDIVRAIVDMGHALNIRVTAEGVETSAQMRLLRKLGCDGLQGFGLARPMSSDDLLAFLQDQAVNAPSTEAVIRRVAE